MNPKCALQPHFLLLSETQNMCLWQSKYILTVLWCMLINHNFIFPHVVILVRAPHKERENAINIFLVLPLQQLACSRTGWWQRWHGLARFRALLLNACCCSCPGWNTPTHTQMRIKSITTHAPLGRRAYCLRCYIWGEKSRWRDGRATLDPRFIVIMHMYAQFIGHSRHMSPCSLAQKSDLSGISARSAA